eukprot:GDKJ01042726.1.p1 GENE.GDKJ01042726.1~~GDKJ01042726.1.p1  ORF type:complete len:656 (-),score=133.31 GDKJ01042726.1:40-1971(-)
MDLVVSSSFSIFIFTNTISLITKADPNSASNFRAITNSSKNETEFCAEDNLRNLLVQQLCTFLLTSVMLPFLPPDFKSQMSSLIQRRHLSTQHVENATREKQDEEKQNKMDEVTLPIFDEDASLASLIFPQQQQHRILPPSFLRREALATLKNMLLHWPKVDTRSPSVSKGELIEVIHHIFDKFFTPGKMALNSDIILQIILLLDMIIPRQLLSMILPVSALSALANCLLISCLENDETKNEEREHFEALSSYLLSNPRDGKSVSDGIFVASMHLRGRNLETLATHQSNSLLLSLTILLVEFQRATNQVNKAAALQQLTAFAERVQSVDPLVASIASNTSSIGGWEGGGDTRSSSAAQNVGNSFLKENTSTLLPFLSQPTSNLLVRLSDGSGLASVLEQLLNESCCLTEKIEYESKKNLRSNESEIKKLESEKEEVQNLRLLSVSRVCNACRGPISTNSSSNKAGDDPNPNSSRHLYSSSRTSIHFLCGHTFHSTCCIDNILDFSNNRNSDSKPTTFTNNDSGPKGSTLTSKQVEPACPICHPLLVQNKKLSRMKTASLSNMDRLIKIIGTTSQTTANNSMVSNVRGNDEALTETLKLLGGAFMDSNTSISSNFSANVQEDIQKSDLEDTETDWSDSNEWRFC